MCILYSSKGGGGVLIFGEIGSKTFVLCIFAKVQQRDFIQSVVL